MTLEEVQLRLRQAQANPSLDEAQKAAVTGLYTQAIQQLELAEQCADVAAHHDAQRAKAPELLQAAQAELEHPPALDAPDVPADAPLPQLETALAQVEADLERARIAETELLSMQDRWLRRRLELPNEQTIAQQHLTELVEERPEGTQQASGVELARRTLLQARRIALETEIQRYQKELLTYAAYRGLFKTRLELAQRRVAALAALAGEWRGRVQQQRSHDAEQELDDIRPLAAQAPAAVRSLAEESLQFAREGVELDRNTRQAEDRLHELNQRLARVRTALETIEKRVQAAGMSGGIGVLLQQNRAQLPNVRPNERELREYKGHMGDVRRRMSELDDRRATLANADEIVQAMRSQLDPQASADEQTQAETVAREWVRREQTQVDGLLAGYGNYFDTLVRLDARDRQFVDEVRHLAAYTEASALWLRSSPPARLADLAHAGETIVWLVRPASVWGLLGSVRDAVLTRAGTIAPALLLVVALFALRPRLRGALISTGQFVFRPRKDSMTVTGQALVYTALLAAAWPAALALAGWVVGLPSEAPEIARSVSAGLLATAAVLFTTRLAAELVAANGLGEKHFRWHAAGLQLVRSNLPWLTAVLVPVAFLFAGLASQSSGDRKDSLGRAAFVLAALAVAGFAHRMLHSGLRPRAPGSRDVGWSQILRQLAYLLAIAAPVALAAAAVVGYYYSALYLSWKLLVSVWLALALTLVHALLHRWLRLRMQRRALREAQERAVQAAQQQKEGENQGPTVPTEEPGLDLADVRIRTSRLARAVIAVAAVIGFWMVWANVLPAVEVLRSVTLWTNQVDVAQTVALPDGTSTVSKVTKALPVTLADLGLSLTILVLTVVAARNIPGLLEVAVLERLPLAPSGRYAIATISGYVIGVVGTVLAFGAIGVGWSKVQWLVAAMTVGLGFGLQEIFANFVSGLIILFERPVRVGDAVTVGDTSGIVTRIRMRATTITDWDHKELIVPNKRFITGEVLNWTLSDPVIRLVLPISVAHGSNAGLVRDTLIAIAKAHPNLATEPPPSAMFRGLGASSMDFELSVFVRREDYGKVQHELNSEVEEALVARGIGIAMPIQLQQIQVRAVGDGKSTA